MRALAGESGGLGAMRPSGDTWPGAADLWLVRTLPAISGNLTAWRLRRAAKAGLLQRFRVVGGTAARRGCTAAAGVILLHLPLQKARCPAISGAALLHCGVALDPDKHCARRLRITNRLRVEDGIRRDVDVTRELGVGVQTAIVRLAGVAEPAGQHARVRRVRCVSDYASDEVSVF
jgi:hypothetical protein